MNTEEYNALIEENAMLNEQLATKTAANHQLVRMVEDLEKKLKIEIDKLKTLPSDVKNLFLAAKELVSLNPGNDAWYASEARLAIIVGEFKDKYNAD